MRECRLETFWSEEIRRCAWGGRVCREGEGWDSMDMS